MKRTISLFLILSLICLLAACGTSQTASSAEEVYYADEDFISDLAKGLEARWEIQEPEDSFEYYTEEHRELYTKYVDAELQYIEKYRDEKFEDKKLQEKAISYINACDDQKAAMKYVTVDQEKSDNMWVEAYDTRTKLIEEFVNKYGLTVKEKYQSTLDDLLTNAETVRGNEEVEKKVDALCKSIVFEKTEDNEYWDTYTAIVENNTGMDFAEYSVDLNLIDADGVIVDTAYASVSNFKNGQKAKFEFDTEEEFINTEITCSYYEVR